MRISEVLKRLQHTRGWYLDGSCIRRRSGTRGVLQCPISALRRKGYDLFSIAAVELSLSTAAMWAIVNAADSHTASPLRKRLLAVTVNRQRGKKTT